MDLEQLKADKVMDTRGLSPPMPLVKSRKALSRMKTGKILEIWCTDPEAQQEIPSLHGECGGAYLGCVTDPEGYTRFFIQKGPAGYTGLANFQSPAAPAGTAGTGRDNDNAR
ncbi:MAG: sulfurtransferase TusA family protein [Thermodesulfobacteriota bacterium]